MSRYSPQLRWISRYSPEPPHVRSAGCEVRAGVFVRRGVPVNKALFTETARALTAKVPGRPPPKQMRLFKFWLSTPGVPALWRAPGGGSGPADPDGLGQRQSFQSGRLAQCCMQGQGFRRQRSRAPSCGDPMGLLRLLATICAREHRQWCVLGVSAPFVSGCFLLEPRRRMAKYPRSAGRQPSCAHPGAPLRESGAPADGPSSSPSRAVPAPRLHPLTRVRACARLFAGQVAATPWASVG